MGIPLNIDWQQILLHLLNFVILAGGLYFLLYKPVKGFMEKRTAHFQEMETAAQEKIKAAEEMQASYAQKMQEADELILRKKAEAQRASETAARQRLDAASAQAGVILEDARKSADRSRKKAVRDAQKELQAMAIAAAKKIVLPGDADVIDQFLKTAEGRSSDAHTEK